jgi:hypothetical protein
MFDNVAVTQGAAFPFGDPVTPAPTIVEPLFPEAATVSLSAVDPHATEVTVFSNGGQIGNVVQAGFPGGTADVPISPSLVNGADITATQIVGGLESCDSIPVTVAVPAVSIADAVLGPGQTTVQVADLAEGAASQVRVFKNETTAIGTAANPATDPVTVTTAALGFGDTITATQTIGGVQGPASVGIDVTVPAPTLPGPAIVGDTIVTVADLHSLATDATVYVNGSPVGSAPTGGQGVVSVMIGASLIANDEVTATQTIGGTEGDMSDTIIAEPPLCFEFFADDLNTDTSAAWNVVIFDSAAENDANAVFAFDYSAVGVPASPNGGGTTRGLKFVVNQGGTAATASVTASPAGQNFTAANGYRLAFDMWINANGPFPDGGGGSTEFLTAGVGYDNTTPNLGNATGNGGWFAISGESGSSRDVRPYKDDEEQFPESGQYAAGTTSGVHNNTNNDEFYFDLFGTPSPPAEQTALFPNQTGDLLTGSAGFAWHEVNITALETKARWEIDGTTIVTLDTTIGNPFSGLDGNVSLGYMDVFTSISDNPAVSFGLVDNVKVFVTHTPGTNGDWDNDSNVDIDDFQAFEDCMGGPGLTPDPSSGLGCASTCNGVFDADLDDDMDMGDFAEFQVQFMP